MAQYTLKELTTAQHYLNVLITHGSIFQPEIRDALWVGFGFVTEEVKRRATSEATQEREANP